MSTAVAAMLLATSCQNEEIINQQESNYFRLEVQKGGSSRTAIASDGSVTWSKGDKLFVYGENGTYGTLMLDDKDAGSESGTFNGFVYGNIKDLKYVAYGDGVKKVGDEVKVTLGDITLLNSNAPMFATLNPNNLNSVTLQHVCGVVRMNIVGLPENAIVSVVGKAIAGSATFNEATATLVADNTTTEQTIKVTGAKDSYHIDVPALAGGTIEKILVNSVECDIADVTVVAKTLDASSIPTLNMTGSGLETTPEAVSNIEAIKTAANVKDAVVTVAKGTYTFPSSSIAEGVTIICEEGTTFTGNSGLNINGATVVGATFSNPGNTASTGTINGTFKDCKFEGSNSNRWSYATSKAVFENCEFTATSVYAIHYDGTAGADIMYKNCKITGWVAIAGGHNSLVFDGCEIYGNGTYGVIRTYGDTTIKNCTFDVKNVNSTDVYQDGIHAVDCKITVQNCVNVNGNIEDLFNVSGTGEIVVE